jgi:hypothetical protein
MENSFTVKNGHVILNGVEISHVKTLDVHVDGNSKPEITISFRAASLDTSFSQSKSR